MHIRQEPIAIVGIGCRFPGDSNSPSKLWELLQSPRNVACKIPSDRFNLKRFYHPDGPHHGTTNVQESYFLSEDVRRFDAQFFSIPPAEVEAIDPQHRVLLETIYEALEDAGLPIEGLRGSDTAVYVGLMCNDYAAISNRDYNFIPTYLATGTAASNASSRASYIFDWNGPSMTIDTACSSSLVALNQAVQTLRAGVSRVAVAAGTNLLLDPGPYVSESNLNMLSPTGRSRMWDADADGYARGEGVAAVILKTLSSAMEDGDHIECIIRETAVNQDGRTKGITMPSAIAQASLIRDAYARAGLDPANKSDRCQYFEAHGTGTPAGDPQEAEALSLAFFKPRNPDADDILYVGSVKTVIGHTEGTAGLAGVLKTCMALKYAIIPPNMLFNCLSPEVAPFYKNLHILDAPQPWPSLPDGVPRRASVNSFGFGGTNAHAILESYEPPAKASAEISQQLPRSLTPFTFSATSQKSLTAVVTSYLTYLKTKGSIDLHSLAYTLNSRRSALLVKVAFSATTLEQLCDKMEGRLREAATNPDSLLGASSSQGSSSILGILTGQGAQWAAMGSKLLASFKVARQVIEHLDQSLATLPEDDRPQWTIMKELQSDSASSRIGEAAVAQPLSTAVQILLLYLLHNAGIQFKAIVGHSSGETAAAYAAGFISASDAIRIAYYRGIHAKLASGPGGIKGAMMAVGTSYEDAKEFCRLEDFNGRIVVAASNSPTSVTLSGDADAIDEAKAVFDEEKKFARVLNVDKGYHSHHVLPCSRVFIESLQACDIQVHRAPKDAPIWFSTVHGGKRMQARDDLKALYWADNMENTVLFSQALEAAVEGCGPFNMGLEIGPHPALKGPVTQTIQAMKGKAIPYSGTLSRSKDDVESFSDALGSVWTHSGSTAVNFAKFVETCCSDNGPASLLKGLPTYPWNHDRVFWSESRMAKLFRTQDDSIHELLGSRSPDGTDEELRWQNVLKPKEIPWLSCHALQGQTVFPGTGYIALAMEASIKVADGRSVQCIELCDLQIVKAIAIDDVVGTEILVTMTNITYERQNSKLICADFKSYSPQSKDSGKMVINACCKVLICLGEPSADLLPSRSPPTVGMSEVNIDSFYASMADLGYGYAGPFKGMSTLRRKFGTSSGTIARPPIEVEEPLLFHPGMLDVSLQAMYAAFSAPGDGSLWSIHAPTGIRRVTLIPSLCGKDIPEEVSFDCVVTAYTRNNICGDVDIFTPDGKHKIIEIDGVSFVPFRAATQADDRCLFAEVTWAVESPDGDLALGGRRATPEDYQKAYDCERIGFYYMRTLNDLFGGKEDAGIELQPHHEALLEYAAHINQLVLQGKHQYAKREWITDTHDQICAIIDGYGDDPDFNIMRAVGENLPAVIRGESTILEHMMKDSMLEKYYQDGLGVPIANDSLAKMVAQISHRYPHMNILEIGAGTGGVTGGILEKLGTAFTSYTYTDISSGFFEKAEEKLKVYANRMIFKPLDIEKDPMTQGFTEQAYDMVLASLVLHATKPLEQALRNARQLLKPGGYFVLLEYIESEPKVTGAMRVGVVMGGLPGWWVGRDDSRRYSPNLSLNQWNTILKKTGFSGIDTFTPLLDPLPFPASVFVARAVDDEINLLQRPLRSRAGQIQIQNLILLGGKTLETSQIIEHVEDMLTPYCEKVTKAESIEEICDEDLPPLCTVLSLTDLDCPILKNITKERWESLKDLFATAKNVLWVTRGYRCEEPHAALTVGLCRSIIYELSQLRLQLLDIDKLGKASPTILAEILLRLQLTAQWEESQSQHNILWSTEPEMMIENERLKILRVMPQKAQNDRYNSAKRILTKDLDLLSSVVNLEWHDTAFVLREGNGLQTSSVRSQSTIQVSCSQLHSFQTAVGRLFLSLGTDAETGAKVLSVSGRNSSKISAPKAWSIPVDVGKQSDAQYLSLLARYILSQQILTMIPVGGTLLAHEPEPFLASLLSLQVSAQGSRVVYTTSKPDAGQRDWLYIHPRTPKRSVDQVLPKNVSLFLDLSRDATSGESFASRIAESLPQLCERRDITAFISKESLVMPVACEENLTRMLRKGALFATALSSDVVDDIPLHVMTLREVLSNEISAGPFSIVNWSAEHTVPTMIEPIDTRKDLFKKEKTYWLIGLAGDLGQSICDWMIGHGARYIVLTSRSPKIPSEWIQAHAAAGATISCLLGDVTKMEDLKRVHQEICQTLPQIAGVANGALILRDKTFANTDLESFQAVLRPKVDGTINLSELFSENSLDFFIAFSSIVATMGNTGQSAYSAANSFLKSLIAERRKRGLAGSSIDISRILGVGYTERETKARGKLTERVIEKIMNVTSAMSESDLHQLFAEAVLAGRPNSRLNPELITGIRTLSSDMTNDVFWANNLKFSHFIQDIGDIPVGKESKVARVPVKTQLLSAKSSDDMAKVLKDALISKLKLSIQLPDEEENGETMPLIDLGMDSLVAVEIRAWFLQELAVDLPVLKILGGVSVADLVDYAMQKLHDVLPIAIQTSANKPPVATSTGSAPYSQEVSNQPSTTSGSTSSSDYVGDLGSSSRDIVKDLESPLVEADDLNQALANGKGKGTWVENGTHNLFKPEIIRMDPMSYGQSRFWFMRQYLEDQSAPNFTFWIQVKGSIQVDKLKTALNMVCQRHEALRTCFFAYNDEACQGIMKKSAIQLERKPISGKQELLKIFETVKVHIYDIEMGETLRMVLCEEDIDSFYLIVGYHHIIMDGFSWELLFSDLEKAYKNGYLPSAPRQYSEWAANQLTSVNNGDMAAERDYWKNEFPNPPTVLPLFPMAQVNWRKPMTKYEQHKRSIKLDSSLTTLIKETCRGQKVTTFHFHLAVFKTLLFRFLGINDLCIGIADANRTDDADMSVIGLMLNLLPLRFQLNATQSFVAALKEVRTKVFAALAHSKVPFNVILEDIGVPRASTHSPLFQAFIDYRQANKTTFANFEGYTHLGSVSHSKVPYDVSLNVLEDYRGEIIVTVGAQTSIYSEADVQIIGNSYLNLLETFAKHPTTRVANSQLFAKVEVESAIELGRGPSLHITWPTTLLHRIDEMARANSESIAIKDGYDTVYTYAELAHRVDTIATALDAAAVAEGFIVAVFQQPTANWICSMLAVMRLGAIYVPLDRRQGLPRLATMVKACKPFAILVDCASSEDAKSLGLHDVRVINVALLKTLNAAKIPNRARHDQAGIILLTSGTTGIPKGVVLKHSNLRNQIEGLTKVYNIGKEVVLQQTAFTFDLSLDQIFVGLCNGGSLFVVDEGRRGDSQAIMKIIASEGITYTKATPSEYSSWIRHGATYVTGNNTWKTAFSAGDRLTDTVRQAFCGLDLPQIRLYNGYGPTETTMSALRVTVPLTSNRSHNEPIPIGMPMPNYSIYIVDENMKLLPPGVPGEIFIGGASVSLGYLNEVELTKEMFLDDPWASREYIQNGWTKMYRTGDKGRLTRNGLVLFHGRIEGGTQIKLRGFRIELGEIESTILSAANDALSDVVCTVRGEPEFLVAHAVFSTGFSTVAQNRNIFLTQLLSRVPLPDYMKPTTILPLESMPLTVHHKRDRRAIAALSVSDYFQADKFGSDSRKLTELESKVKHIWQELLPREMSQVSYSPSTDFFQVGGNSLLLVEMQAMIKNTFDIMVALLELLEASTLGKMAVKIQGALLRSEIDWDLETSSPGSATLVKGDPEPLKSKDMEVLLTGATGHLGRFLLPLFVANDSIAKIHCIGVRNPSKLSTTSEKIFIHTGDLAESSLGLSVVSFAFLASNVDTIVHCAAKRSFWEPYRSLRKDNVHPIKELIVMARERNIPIHFLSSGGIARGSAPCTSCFNPSSNGWEGYLASKWVCEKTLERVSTDFNIPVYIYRTTPVVTDSCDLPKVLLDDFAYFSASAKALPDTAAWSGTFDLVHADDVARGVCASVTGNTGDGDIRRSPKYVHFPALARMGSVEHLEMLLDRPEIKVAGLESFEKLPVHQWLGKLKAVGFVWMVGAQDAVLDGKLRLRR